MKKTLAILALAISCSGAWAQIFNPGNGHYYDVISAPGITWPDAEAGALTHFYSGLEGHLATITSADEHTFVNLAIVSAGGGEMWAGGFQNPVTEIDARAGWTWVNGEGTFPGVDSASPYAVWNSGEPNDAYGVASEQYPGLNLGPGFNDEGNLSLITGYVIEYDPDTIPPTVPDGGSSALLLCSALTVFPILRRLSA